MPAPSYPHRHLLLTGLLDSLSTPCPPDAFAVSGETNERGCKLDALLLEGWTATGSKAKLVDRDVLQHAENLRLKKSDFDVLGRVGEGQFGVVDAVRSKLDGKVYAMKTIEKSMVMRAGGQLSLGLERHIHRLANASSPSPAFAASFQSPSSLHLLTTFAPCGSLWDRMCEAIPVPGLETGRMEEEEVGWWAKQMVSAVSWIHGLGYAHRDIKPHNFLLLPDCRLWLTDFGSAAALSNGAVPRRLCLVPTGTPDYVAPEVLRVAEDALVAAAHSDADETDATIRMSTSDAPGYGPEVDWWSLGATLYEMSVGRAPFFSPSIGSTYERIMRCDVRMPNELSPHLKSLLSGLLSPPDVRLGHGDSSQIRNHAFFREMEWSKLGIPPPGLVCQPLDLATLTDSFHSVSEDITFDHFFESTVAGFTDSTSSPSIALNAPVTWGRWVGWSMDPSPEFFGTEPPAITISPPTLKPINGTVRQHSAPPATNLFTPLRPGLLQGATPPTVPRTAPRSVPRTRPVTERQAFAELIQCVQASARKKLASAVLKIPGSASTVSSTASDWRKDHPPTPTPVSRDVTVLRPSSRASVLTAQDDRSQSRTLSDRGYASGRDDLSFPPRPLSRAVSLRDGLPTRSFSRTSSLPVAGESLSHRPSLSSLRSASSGESTATQRINSLRSNADRLSHEPTRSISAASVRGSDRVPRVSTGSLKDDTFLSKLVAVEIQDEDRAPPGTKRSLSELRDSPRVPLMPLPPKATPHKSYIPPRDPDPFKQGDRYAAMQAWHGYIEDGFTNLEMRLANLMTQLSVQL